MIFTILATWFLFIPIAIINGLVRERVYKQFVGDLFAHQISTVIASLAFLVLSYGLLNQKLLSADFIKLFTIGSTWVLMTVLFEFIFGHYIDNISWEKLFDDYNILRGRVWGIFLLIVFLTPFIVKALKLFKFYN